MKNRCENSKYMHYKHNRNHSLIILLVLFSIFFLSFNFTSNHYVHALDSDETYTCGQDEHEHTSECYTNVLVCGQEENDEHTHTEECYESQLTCTLSEHKHTEECLASSDPTSTPETESGGEKSTPENTPQSNDVIPKANNAVSYLNSGIEVSILTDKTEVYTGEAGIVTLNISNPTSEEVDDGSKIRLYMDFKDKELPESATGTTVSGKPSGYEAGNSYTITLSNGDTYGYTVSKVDGYENRYCFEFKRPLNGDTISIQLPSSFANRVSAGGTNTIWTEVVDANGNKLEPSSGDENTNKKEITWNTKADEFLLSKKLNTHPNNFKLKSSYDETTGISTIYITYAEYAVSLKRDPDIKTLEGKGKDYMESVTFVDTVILPEGFGVSQDVIDAIKNGDVFVTTKTIYGSPQNTTYIWKTKSGKTILSIPCYYSTMKTDTYNLVNPRLSINDNDQLVVSFNWENTSVDKNTEEISDFKISLDFGDEIFCANADVIEEGKQYTVTNSVEAIEKFHWSEEKTQEASVSNDLKAGEADITLTKGSVYQNNRYLGEPIDYIITASNQSAFSYKKLGYIEDPLDKSLYLSASNLATLFINDKADKLTVTITNANICPVPTDKTVTTINGKTTKDLTASNVTDTTIVDGKNKYEGMWTSKDSTASITTITLKKLNDSLAISYDDQTITCDLNANSIQTALDNIGYVISQDTKYTVSYDYRNANGTPYTMKAGEKISISLPATFKNTLMYTQGDIRNGIGKIYSAFVYNNVYAYDSEHTRIKYDDTWDSAPYGDLSFSKSASVDGKQLTNGSNAPSDGSVIDYTISERHYGSGTYDVLPIVDHMTGAQVLLAQKTKNSDAVWASTCETTKINDIEYYLLKEGTYEDVWLNGYFAESVVVTKTDEGYDTLIKWYLADIVKDYETKSIKYKALVTVPKGKVTYSINNECWANDHETHRLYSTIGYKGTVLSFVKQIVSENDFENTAKEEGTSFSTISNGESIYYRIKITAPAGSEGDMTISGKSFYDSLPSSLKNYLEWHVAENEEDTSDGSVYVMGYEGGTVTHSSSGVDYSINELSDNSTQQTIKWADDFSITFNAKDPLYIYIRLTFPSGTNYEEYGVKYGSSILDNTFTLLGFNSSVQHVLKLQTKAYLQKSVYDEYWGSKKSVTPKDLNQFSNSRDASFKESRVVFDVTLYNSGDTRLYLQPLQDALPKGYTYVKLGYSYDDPTYANSDYIWYRADDKYGSHSYSDRLGVANNQLYFEVSDGTNSKTVKSEFFYVSRDYSDYDKENNIVTFHVILYDRDGEETHYDEEKKMYYLNPGEGINFSYVCKLDTEENTNDSATNTIAMPYYNYTTAGLSIDKNISVVDTRNYDTDTANDGTCYKWDNDQATNANLKGGNEDTEWLVSSVEQKRGMIKPGITNELTSTTSSSSHPTTASPTDVLNWTLISANDGSQFLSDYVITDTMQSPYMFTGKINYTIKSLNGDALYTLDSDLEIIDSQSDSITLSYTDTNGVKQTKTIHLNEDATELESITSDGNVYIQLTQDKDGNYSLSMRFKGDGLAIPAGGTSELALSTKRIDGGVENKVFINTCYITPMSQTWDITSVNKGNETKVDIAGQQANNRESVRNAAQVTVSYGYNTTSLKSIYEKEYPANSATSNDVVNYIALNKRNDAFTYTLTMNNSDKAMTSLVLIDSLPDRDDHSVFNVDDNRFSAFRVSFANELNLKVQVQYGNGDVVTLEPSQYTAEFSPTTNQEFTKEDWAGTSSWTNDHTNARSIRIRLKDNSGTLIPPKASVIVTFDAIIDDADAKQGTIAWNSFGYHYTVQDSSTSLEAAPLKVGVLIPIKPTVQKFLMNEEGEVTSITKDSSYQLLLYSGENLALTGEDLYTALANDTDRKVTIIDLSVQANVSKSDQVTLDSQKVYQYIDGSWTITDEDWAWINGTTYNVVELTEDALEGITFGNINENDENGTYSFEYVPGNTISINATNVSKFWNYDLTKVDTEYEKVLSSAVFSFYSPNSNDQISDEEYDALLESLSLEKEIDKTITVEDTTYYLTSIVETDKDGKISWKDLFEDSYVYQEVKAPKDYELDDTLHIMRKIDEDHFAIVTNKRVVPDPTPTPDTPKVTPTPETTTIPDEKVTPTTPGHTLPLTGQLLWPIPVLSILGIVFIVVGKKLNKKN